MSEFKQIIGRGTRVRDDYGKLWFNIIDYTGSATRMFADPDFDGDPAKVTEEELKKNGETQVISTTPDPEPESDAGAGDSGAADRGTPEVLLRRGQRRDRRAPRL